MRTLHVHRFHARGYTYASITLAGRWLEQMGFNLGDEVEVIASEIVMEEGGEPETVVSLRNLKNKNTTNNQPQKTNG